MADDIAESKPKKQIDSYPKSIAEVLDLFVKQVDGLAETLRLAVRAIRVAQLTAQSELSNFFLHECTRDETGKTFIIEAGKIFHYQRLRGRIHKTRLADQLVPGSFLVSLVSQFDAFLGGLIRQLFEIKPEILNSSENTLTFSQMVEFGSIEVATQYVIDKEIESVLRKSHPEPFEWLDRKFGIRLKVDLPSWPVFVEVTERRNLVVHTNGIISHQYLAICREHSVKIEPSMVVGAKLTVSQQYFETARECLLEIGTKLAQVLWRKLNPDDLEAADKSLIDITFELLAEGRYKIARCLLDFGTETLKKHSSEARRLILVVNRAQAYKWTGEEEEAKKIVESEDWSAVVPRFRLAQAVLLDDFGKAIEIMKQIGADSDKSMSKLAYRKWPLFKEIRKTYEFAVAFEAIFGEPLNVIDIDETNEEPPPPTIH